MFSAHYLIYLLLAAGVYLSIRAHKLTVAGALTGGVVGLLVFEGGGYAGLAMLALFFIAGSAATKLGVHNKETIGAAEERDGSRTAGQVLANGGVAALLGLACLLIPNYAPLFMLMMAGSLASALADTLSSELGMLYGRRTFNVLTLKPDQRGQNGVISLEGTLIGIAGAALIAAVYSLAYGWNINFIWIIIAGFAGNLMDSVLGALLERKGLIGNNLVNFLNTLAAALICWLLH
ncbi:uncharacterized protein (TIGR00297 family) [Mucilaginibacter yixingensis]|uniref:Uncharacterized protein (TIGR00297 family) n=1 Tax=Mucilaginibacter yixingensis TaxID=1295612 RepID=A0A2T5J6Y0_9SPHI|nr:DUF92 domain-containing protein [Mucilaginibacter yixingensis]PTQ94821.1 uncharacterized protein (TIGR00297 family) [Mucilaginibacter yixingensis]